MLPYLLLALLVLAVQPLLSWYHRLTEEEVITIEYLPEGASQPITYQVKAESIQRVGDCITFLPEGDNEAMTLCERYRELRRE